jgi:GTP cyclohydrolase I
MSSPPLRAVDTALPAPVDSPSEADADIGTPVSVRIRERIKQAQRRFYANDNIAEFIEPGELEALLDEVQGKMEGVLSSLVIDTESDHNTQETARRVAKMYLQEIFKGRYLNAPPVTEFPNVERLNELMIVGPITVRSACSHHLCPIIGRVWIGVMPNEHSNLIGLSKYARLIDWIMSRPQIHPGRRCLAIAHAARWLGRGDGSRSLLHALAWRQGHGCQDDQQRHARILPQRPQSAARIPFFGQPQERLTHHAGEIAVRQSLRPGVDTRGH